MGTKNVLAVYDHWGHLNDRPFRMLVRMAFTAYDNPKKGVMARRYFGSREALAHSIGRTLPSEEEAAISDEARRARHATLEAVGQCITYLVRVGALKRLTISRDGVRAEYRLVLDPGEIRQNLIESQAQPDSNQGVPDRGTGLPCADTGSACPEGQGAPVAKKQRRKSVEEDSQEPAEKSFEGSPTRGSSGAFEFDSSDRPPTQRGSSRWRDAPPVRRRGSASELADFFEDQVRDSAEQPLGPAPFSHDGLRREIRRWMRDEELESEHIRRMITRFASLGNFSGDKPVWLLFVNQEADLSGWVEHHFSHRRRFASERRPSLDGKRRAP